MLVPYLLTPINIRVYLSKYNPLTIPAEENQTPLYIPDHAELTATMVRCTDNRKVWYEWAVETWGLTDLIGGGKRRVRLGGGEVGSSKAGGCMM